ALQFHEGSFLWSVVHPSFSFPPLSGSCSQKKSAPHLSRALSCHAKRALFNNDKVRITRANHALRVGKTVHINGDPTTVQEYEVRIPDQPEMARTVSLYEEFFRVSPKTKYFAVTRSELFLVDCRRVIRIHVRLTGVRTRTRLVLVYVSAPLNVRVRLFTYVRPGLRFCLWIALILCGTHLFS